MIFLSDEALDVDRLLAKWLKTHTASDHGERPSLAGGGGKRGKGEGVWGGPCWTRTTPPQTLSIQSIVDMAAVWQPVLRACMRTAY